MDMEKRFSSVARKIRRSPIRLVMQQASGIEGLAKLGGGQPQSELFPIGPSAIEVEITHYPENHAGPAKKKVSAPLGDIVLNYNGQTYNKGLPFLLAWIKRHVQKYHRPKIGSSDVCVTSGSTDALNKCVQLLTAPGDIILSAEYCYTGILVSPRAHGRCVVGVRMDENGILPESLDEVCTSKASAGTKAKMLYIVPTGQNPTGSTMPLKRRRRVYEICRKHDLIIIEDDPYFFLQMNPYRRELAEGTTRGDVGADEKIERTPSFLSIDTDGRVIRLDSFSKTIAPGFRLGYVTGPSVFVEKLDQMNQVTTWSSSGIAQTVLAALLDGWGESGFESHVRSLRRTYEIRRNALLDAMEKNLRGTIASWSPPSAGMFVWIRFNGVRDTRDCVDLILKAKVVMIPGGSFQPDSDRPCPYFRATFATAPIESFEKAMTRLASALKAYERRRKERASGTGTSKYGE